MKEMIETLKLKLQKEIEVSCKEVSNEIDTKVQSIELSFKS